ncbi:uncharacterized protein N0V89_008708 [Didymosphaeria variabile]|uniref:F-box domain-containing protein n=1 Tax=Didymosphaeria variabile TaxID=1932322 RepID=A0A9W8XI25_9PLEO|nr:uncharacterized protein N0V89_008708 [Didymosphaeria variabile]KAJ4350087.1 hypothetical protein N0V89_008708 [Didymosphaeria variabile]
MADNDIPQSRLLQLPGELRNGIYEYAREDDTVGVHVARSLNSTGTTPMTRTQPWFLGLTQTCRAIRKEFRPVYMEHTVFSMRLLGAYTFIAAYVPSHVEVFCGNVLINFDYGLSLLETNILPLLQIMRRFSRLSVRANCSNTGFREDLDNLLNARAGGWFDEDVLTKVVRITVKKRAPCIAITWDIKCADTKSELYLPRDATLSTRRMWHAACFEWLSEKGLVMNELAVLFRPVWSSEGRDP